MAEDLPTELLERLRQILPPAALEAFVGLADMPRPTYLRVNRLQTTPEALTEELAAAGIEAQPVAGFPDALEVPAAQRRALTEHPAFHQGRLYIQGLSSQLAAPLLDPQPGEAVLDLAAAPGGKTLHLAMRMQNRGRLSAVEPVKDRFFRLRANLERAGVTIARTYLMDGRAVGRKVPGRFDRVLLDAPCSSEARIRAGRPESWAHWSPRKIAEQSKKQRRLLLSGLEALRPGGRLLYCTCSFAPEENELVVAHALRRRDDLRLLPLELPLQNWQPGLEAWNGKPIDPRLRHSRRILPDVRTDGFFLALLEREA